MVTGKPDDALDEMVLGVLGKQPDKDEEACSGPPTSDVPFVAAPLSQGNGSAGSSNTTTSPRRRSKGPGVSLLTMTRSSDARVSSIDPDGM